MPQSLIYISGIELFLILFTTFMLLRPRYRKIKSKAMRARAMRFGAASWLGFFFLGILFLWSVVLGVVLSIHRLPF